MSVPEEILAVTGGRSVRAVWRNETGGTTYEVDGGRSFIKWSPLRVIDLDAEAARLRWAAPYATVPRVIDSGTSPTGMWLRTAGLPGSNAVSPQWIADPATAVWAIGTGLRALHDTLPVSGCPFSWSTEYRVAEINAHQERLDPDRWHPEHRGLSVAQALVRLADQPPVEKLVVCHGDACAPNTLLDAGGNFAGQVDFGALGLADRWADLAVATWSADWNYGPGRDIELLRAYGIAPDPERTAYYRLLWDLGP